MRLKRKGKKIGRRDFLRGSLATATIAGLSAPSALEVVPLTSANGPGSQPTQGTQKKANVSRTLGLREKFFMPYAVFRELQFGSVRPEGWLRLELTKQANGITGHQPDFCFPFDRRYWDSNERSQAAATPNWGIFWYPWEQMGYWTDGRQPCTLGLSVASRLKATIEPIRYTVEHPID